MRRVRGGADALRRKQAVDVGHADVHQDHGWPSVAIVGGVAPVALAESGAAVPAAIGVIATAAILTRLASRDADTESQ